MPHVIHILVSDEGDLYPPSLFRDYLSTSPPLPFQEGLIPLSFKGEGEVWVLKGQSPFKLPLINNLIIPQVDFHLSLLRSQLGFQSPFARKMQLDLEVADLYQPLFDIPQLHH